MMTLAEARHIGQSKLSIDKGLFDRCKRAAHEMEVTPQHMGPMTLAIAVMGLAKVDKQDMQSELTDALALVARAEREWRLEMKGMN